MQFVFLHVNDDANNYVREKLQALKNRHSDSDTLLTETSSTVNNALSHLNNEPPQFAAKEEQYDASKEQLKLVAVAQRCALQNLVEMAPLTDGEEIVEDFFSYLTKPFNDLPENTAVLKRTTNKAEVLYLFDDVKVANGDLVYNVPELTFDVHSAQSLGISFTITSKMIKSLLKNAASAVLSQVGSIIFDIIAKELFGDDTQKMIDKIKEVIQEEIVSNELDKMNGAVQGTLQFLCVEYNNRKMQTDLSDPAKRRELLADLKPYSTKFYTDVIGVLKQDKFAEKGLKSFMTAASVHLLITQEMALVDPDYMDPNESSYLKTFRANASSYQAHVSTNYHNAYNRRNNMEVYTKQFTDCMGTSCVHTTSYHWRDNVSGETAGGFTNTKNPDVTAGEHARRSLEKHRTKVLNELLEKLGHPQETFLDGISSLEHYSFPKK